MNRSLGLIGVPSSAGAFAPGQEKAPKALRDAGLVEKLTGAGVSIHDYGDAPVWRWKPDRANPFAQNLTAVVDIARDTADRVRAALDSGQIPLLLGGDCTIELGTVAGHLPANDRIALLYFDLHPDINIPGTPVDAALDWTGMAHMLGESATAESLSHLGSRFPLLSPAEVLLFGYGPAQSTARELEAIERLGLKTIPVDEVRQDPEAAARTALAWFEPRCDRLLVHFDVDMIDFTDMPLSENTGRNIGLSFDLAMRALKVIVQSERLSSLTVTELNPDHGEEDGTTIRTFVNSLVSALAGAPVLVRA